MLRYLKQDGYSIKLCSYSAWPNSSYIIIVMYVRNLFYFETAMNLYVSSHAEPT